MCKHLGWGREPHSFFEPDDYRREEEEEWRGGGGRERRIKRSLFFVRNICICQKKVEILRTKKKKREK